MPFFISSKAVKQEYGIETCQVIEVMEKKHIKIYDIQRYLIGTLADFEEWLRSKEKDYIDKLSNQKDSIVSSIMRGYIYSDGYGYEDEKRRARYVIETYKEDVNRACEYFKKENYLNDESVERIFFEEKEFDEKLYELYGHRFDKIEPISNINTNEHYIREWESILDKLEGAERTAALLAIEKFRGKTHREAYRFVFPDKSVVEPENYVSRMRAPAKGVAEKFGLTMPGWQANRP